MTIQSKVITVGDPLPDVCIKTMIGGAPQDVTLRTICDVGTTVLFAVPGAYTPACSARHLPGYLEHGAALKAKGVDRLACIAVNDVFVMDAWARENNVGDKILMLADGNAELTKALGLESDARAYGMGVRSQRFAMVVKNGRVAHLFVDEPGAFEMSAASYVLSKL